MRQFLMGNEVLAQAAFDIGAQIMFGYPITPTTEVLSNWIRLAQKNNRKYLQTEDEIAAGFRVCGSVMAGVPAFTATAGPGTILMQDPMSMAEAMRLPTVCLIGQRGGPSTGTVIYSQQELNLAVFGGNGEGLRLVYSPSTLEELYHLTVKAFQNAWKFRFPTFVLYDGYLGKMKGGVDIKKESGIGNQELRSEPILTTNIRNCYSTEEELYEQDMHHYADWREMAQQVCEFEISGEKSDTLVVAHGIVANAARQADVYLFRPITVWPFPEKDLREKVAVVKRVLVLESSLGQLARFVKNSLYGMSVEVEVIGKPALGFTPEEIARYGT